MSVLSEIVRIVGRLLPESVCRLCGYDNPYMDDVPDYVCRQCQTRSKKWSDAPVAPNSDEMGDNTCRECGGTDVEKDGDLCDGCANDQSVTNSLSPRQNVIDVIGITESAPSGAILARNHTKQGITPEEENDLYNSSEGECDSVTEDTVNGMDEEELKSLIDTLVDIVDDHWNDYKDSPEDWEEWTGGNDPYELLGVPHPDDR